MFASHVHRKIPTSPIFYLAKYFDGAFNIFQRMGSRRDKAQHDNSLGTTGYTTIEQKYLSLKSTTMLVLLCH